MNLLKKDLLQFWIYKYKTEEISPKDFRNYQNPTELFNDLRVVMICGNINPKHIKKSKKI